jgi:ATP-dependent RNA helicase DeaD
MSSTTRTANALPQTDELLDTSTRATPQERHRPGFDDVVWFRMDVGRRQNADPRWLLPLLCRRGHITKNEVGAIRIGNAETYFQVPRAIAGRFADALARTTGGDAGDGEDSIRIIPSDSGPPEGRSPPARGDTRPEAPRRGTLRPAAIPGIVTPTRPGAARPQRPFRKAPDGKPGGPRRDK